MEAAAGPEGCLKKLIKRLISESLTKSQRSVIDSMRAKGRPLPAWYPGDPEPISDWEEYLRKAFVRLHTDRAEPGLPIPYRHINAYAKQEGFEGQSLELFVDVMMYVDTAFRNKDETKVEEAQPDAITVQAGGERMPVDRAALGWSTSKSGSSSTQPKVDVTSVGSSKISVG